MSTFNVVWDSGKPCEESCADRVEVESLLNDLMTEAELEEYAYFDIWVYEGDKDVTDSFLALNPEREMIKETAQEKRISEDVLNEVD
jgi:hypothetical protein